MNIQEMKSKLGEHWDELIPDALNIIKDVGYCSTSCLQRRLRIGYAKAARIIDILEEQGIVSPINPIEPRKILIDLTELIGDSE